MLKPWKLISAKTLIKNRWMHLIEERLETKSGGVIEPFYRFDNNHWGLVIARTKKGEFVLVEQYRRGTDSLCIEFTAGGFDPGEDPAVGMMRELGEETGYQSQEEIELLGHYPVNPANQNGEVYIFFWDQVELKVEPQSDPTEEIKVHLVNEETLKDWIKTKTIVHPLHHFSWLLYLDRLK